jgi:ABC-type multidrug transport system ATPase subunit
MAPRIGNYDSDQRPGQELRLERSAARRRFARPRRRVCFAGRRQRRRQDNSHAYRSHAAQTAENLLFFARLYRLDNQADRVAEALKEVGLIARQRDSVSTFSRGMVQRLTIARATLHEPEVLLLDEPYTGLDQDAARLLDDLLKREMDKGRTILMITHDLVHGLNLCHRSVVLSRGKIVVEVDSSQVSPSEFLDVYAEKTRRATRQSVGKAKR